MTVYPLCKICGDSHEMGIEDMVTGEITPIDLCHSCFWKDIEILDSKELAEVLDAELEKCMKSLEKDLLL